MEIIKQTNDSNKDILTVINDNGSQFHMEFGGADFYYIMNDYYDGNEFIIDKNNPLYIPLKKVFQVIKKKDDKWESTLKNNVFTWYSEAYGIIEEHSSLQIINNEDAFIISFIRSPKDIMGRATKSCYISFCMSGSRHQDIAYAFSSMFINFPITPNNCKQKKKEK